MLCARPSWPGIDLERYALAAQLGPIEDCYIEVLLLACITEVPQVPCPRTAAHEGGRPQEKRVQCGGHRGLAVFAREPGMEVQPTRNHAVRVLLPQRRGRGCYNWRHGRSQAVA